MQQRTFLDACIYIYIVFLVPMLTNSGVASLPQLRQAGKLLCGVLDWGGFGASCLGHKLWWYFNCSEFEMLKERTDAEVTEPSH